MLIQFTVKNYKCFKEETTLSMVASKYDLKTRWDDNVFEIPKFNLNLLKSAVIYGANASGKTKLVEAMEFIRSMMLTSSKDKQSSEKIAEQPFSFRLNSDSEKEPSLFEINFIINNEMFRYGFEVNQEEVISEWLYHRPETKEVELFYRDNQEFKIHPKNNKLKLLVKNTLVRKNALLLSVAAQFNDKKSQKILEWIESEFIVLSDLEENINKATAKQMLKNEIFKGDILKYLQNADLNIEDLKPVKFHIENLPQNIQSDFKKKFEKLEEADKNLFSDVSVFHKKFDKTKKSIGIEKFSLEQDESSGTKKYFASSALIILALEIGITIAIDELDAKLHPNLVCKIISTFNSKETNPKNAQLIFNTHDTNLLSSGLFRRDQIWFVEKDRYGASSLYSLVDFKTENGEKARMGEDFEKNYIKGKYGAIPYLNNFEKLFVNQNEVAHENEK